MGSAASMHRMVHELTTGTYECCQDDTTVVKVRSITAHGRHSRARHTRLQRA
jgi:hypothetical protein